MPSEATLPVGRVPAGSFGIRLRRIGHRLRIPLFCYIALLPVLVLFFYVRIIPIGFGFVLSLYRWNMISPRKPFVGLANYVQLFGDENFIAALKNTTIYSFATVILTTVLALPLAVFLARKSRFSPFYQTIYFLPVITPLIPMSIAWKWIYDYNYGVLNYLLSLVDLPAGAVADRSIDCAVGGHHDDGMEAAWLRDGAVPGGAPQHPARIRRGRQHRRRL